MAQVEVRPANLVTDRDSLVALLKTYSTERSTLQRYRWLYENCPHGPAAIFLAVDSATGATVGSGAVLPRRMRVNGAVSLAAVMADFWIHPDHRSLGPAVKLQRACIDHAAAMGFGFYDLPQGNMSAVYARMRLLGRTSLTRYAKPLSAAPFVRRVVPGHTAGRVASAIGDAALRLSERWATRRTNLQVERYDGDFGAEFDQLAEEQAPSPAVCVARGAGYLQWRYRQHYHLKYSAFTARDGGALRAYAVVLESGQYAEILDLYPTGERSAAVDLLVGVVRHMRELGVLAIYASVFDSDGALGRVFASAGLRRRERRPFVIHEFVGTGRSSDDSAGSRWSLTYGDIDY